MAVKASKPTQTERAYDALKRDIVRGEIPEASFLSEPRIMKRYGIGRTPYREACNRLHHEGLLQVVPRRGYFVPEISFQTVRDLFEARLILEEALVELAVARATDEEIAEMETLVRRVPSRSARDHAQQLIETNARFHLQLAKSARNAELTELLRRNLENTERLMYLELRSSTFRIEDFRMLHGQITAALRKRDSEAARRAIWRDLTQAQSLSLSSEWKMRKKGRRPAAAAKSK